MRSCYDLYLIYLNIIITIPYPNAYCVQLWGNFITSKMELYLTGSAE
jgi:hypothetical protein